MAGKTESFDRDRYRQEVQQQMDGLSKEACVAVAARAALRVAPFFYVRMGLPEKTHAWWQEFGAYITAQLCLAACYELYGSELNLLAVAYINHGRFVPSESDLAVSSVAEATACAVEALSDRDLAVARNAAANACAYAVLAAKSAVSFEINQRDQLSSRLVFESVVWDLQYAHKQSGPVTLRQLWPAQTPVDWLNAWLGAAEDNMADKAWARDLHSWLVEWHKGKAPAFRMMLWFDEWWLQHSENLNREPAFRNMGTWYSRAVLGKLPNEIISTESTLTPIDDSTASAVMPATDLPESPPTSSQDSELPEKVVVHRHLESTVALASDREAKQLTPTAEKCKEALARFLASAETQTPLTVSIEAPWGAGKTSFMSHLRKRLEAEMIPTVWFNPWKHEAGKTMWAAFALEYERQMARQLWLPRRVCCRVLLNFRRMGWSGATLLLLRLGLWIGVGVLLWLVAPEVKATLDAVLKQAGEDSAFRDWLIKWLPLVGPAWIILKDVIKITSIPLKRESMQGLNRDPHAEGVDDLHRFHEDFARLMRAYHPANGWWARLFQRKRLRRVVVFIDDLDRCEAPKAADVLQSLHLMLNVTESAGKRMPEMICVLGMDRKKVAAAVAAKHEKLLPMLVAEDDKGTVTPARALAFGNQFLEKFIQLTQHLPGMMGADRVHYLREITGLRPDAKPLTGAPIPPGARQAPKGSPLAAAVPPSGATSAPTLPRVSIGDEVAQAEDAKAKEQERVQVRVRNVDEHLHDGQTAFDCASYVADALENNPRRLKQFVNLLRLRLLLAAALDLLDADTLSADVSVVKEGKLSAHQLAKLVALDLMCPQSMAKMRGNPGIWYSTLADLAKAENAERSDAITVMLNHGRRLNPDPLRNLYVLDGAPLEAYFQQLATVAPAPITGPIDVEHMLEDQELAERRGRAGLK